MTDINIKNHENPEFREFIRRVLERVDLGEKYIDMFTDDKCMIEFTKAFTHNSIDPIDNYEFYEILGDATSNKVVVWYFIRRFPEIFNDAKGTGGNMGPTAIMARLKQNGVSKSAYSKFSESLGFWDYVRKTDEYNKDRTKIMEDVFEAFCGCLELIVDTKVTNHSGYGIVYNLMKTLMDPLDISTDREELYDSKSILNEEIIPLKKKIDMKYITTQDFTITKETTDPSAYKRRFQSHVMIYDKINNKTYNSSKFFGAKKGDAEKKAAQYVLDSKLLDQFK